MILYGISQYQEEIGLFRFETKQPSLHLTLNSYKTQNRQIEGYAGSWKQWTSWSACFHVSWYNHRAVMVAQLAQQEKKQIHLSEEHPFTNSGTQFNSPWESAWSCKYNTKVRGMGESYLKFQCAVSSSPVQEHRPCFFGKKHLPGRICHFSPKKGLSDSFTYFISSYFIVHLSSKLFSSSKYVVQFKHKFSW